MNKLEDRIKVYDRLVKVGGSMYTCYDCERFGNGCDGIIPPPGYRNRIEDYCKDFYLVKWRSDMFKEAGKRRLSR